MPVELDSILISFVWVGFVDEVCSVVVVVGFKVNRITLSNICLNLAAQSICSLLGEAARLLDTIFGFGHCEAKIDGRDRQSIAGIAGICSSGELVGLLWRHAPQ